MFDNLLIISMPYTINLMESFINRVEHISPFIAMYRALSELPHTQPIAGVRIGLVGGEFIVNPTTKEMQESELDLVLAGTDSAILMIEVDVPSLKPLLMLA